MQDKEHPHAKVLHLPRNPVMTSSPGGDVLRTLLQTLREADPVAERLPAAATVDGGGQASELVQMARGNANIQAHQHAALRQEIDGSNNIQLSGLNVVVTLGAGARSASVFDAIPLAWRVVAYVLIVVVAFFA